MIANLVFRRRLNSGLILGSTGLEITTWFWISCALITIAASQQSFYTNGRYGKRQDPEQATLFRSGSRYGRRNGGVITERNGPSSKQVEVTPRMDRFFLGSRYGKRTISNDHVIDSSKHFESSLDFLISVDRRFTGKEQLKILTQQLRDNSRDHVGRSSRDQSTVPKMFLTHDHDLACFYTGMTSLYRCIRRGDASRDSLNWNDLL